MSKVVTQTAPDGTVKTTVIPTGEKRIIALTEPGRHTIKVSDNAILKRLKAFTAASPTKLTAFSALPSGNADGKANMVVGAGTGTVDSNGLTVTADFVNNWSGTQVATGDLRGGSLQIRLDVNGQFMTGGRDISGRDVDGWQWSFWKAASEFGGNVEMGFIHQGQVAPRGILRGLTGDTILETKFPSTMAAGKVIEIRAWAASSSRPNTPTETYVLGSSEDQWPDPLGMIPTAVGVNSINGSAVIKSVQATIFRPEIETQASASAAWTTRLLNGVPHLSCIAQGNEIKARSAHGNTRVGWELGRDPAAPYPPRVALYVDAALQGVYEVPESGTLWVDTNPDAVQDISLVVSGTHEDGALWSGVNAVYVRRLVADGGVILPYIEERLQILVVSDSTGAGIVARGHHVPAPVSIPAQSAGELSWPAVLGRLVDACVTDTSFGGQGMTRGGAGGVPPVNATSGLAMQGTPLQWRNGLPTLVVSGHGANDATADPATFKANYKAWVAKTKGLYPAASLLLVAPLNGDLSALVEQIASETECQFLRVPGMTFVDETHPDPPGNANAAAAIAAKIQASAS